MVEAIAYLESEREGYGLRIADEVDVVVAQILEFPSSGTQLAEYPAELGVRAFHLKTFRYSLIVARIEDDPVVFAVAHQHRRPGDWKERLK